MKNFLFVLLALLYSFPALASFSLPPTPYVDGFILAGFHGGGIGGGIGACPFPTYYGSGASINDGCDQAPPTLLSASLGYPANSALLTSSGLFQSGQLLASPFHDLAHPTTSKMNWNVAGSEFPVGIPPCAATGSYTCPLYPSSPGSYCSTDSRETTRPCSHDSLGGVVPIIDASKYSWTTDPAGTGCTSPANYPSSGAQLYAIQCAAGSTTNVVGFDFGPYDVSAGHYICVGLWVTDTLGGATSGSINVSGNRTFWSSDTSCTTLNNEIAAGQMTPMFIAPAHGPWTVTIWSNLFDQNSVNLYNPAGGAQGFPYGQPLAYGTPNPPGTVYTINNSLSIRYNYFHNLMWRAVAISSAPCGGYEFVGNVVHNLGDHQAGFHGNTVSWQITAGGASGAYYERPACPGYSNGSAAGTGYPVSAPNGWASGTYGVMQYDNTINNTMWNDTTVRGDASEWVHFEAGATAAAALTNVLVAKVSLNTLVPNLPLDAGGNQIYYMYTGSSALIFNSSGSTYTPVFGDLLTAVMPVCATGVTPYTYQPTIWWSTSSASGAKWAEDGDCGYTNPIVWKFNGYLASGTTTLNVSSVTSPASVQPSLPDAGASPSQPGQTLNGYVHYTAPGVHVPIHIVSCTPACVPTSGITSVTIDAEPDTAYNTPQAIGSSGSPVALHFDGNTNNIHLLCKVCTGSGAPASGTDIGWLIDNNSFENTYIANIITLSGVASNASSCTTNPNCMSQPFENFQSLTVGPNLINQYTRQATTPVQTASQGIYTWPTSLGYYMSCLVSPVLPSGSVLPPPSFFGAQGNGNAIMSNNFDSDGTSRNATFATDTGC